VSIFLGILISLSSTSAVANIVAGTMLTYAGAFRVGDFVKIGDTVGEVTAKKLLLTRVRTIKHVDVAIPNSVVLGRSVLNYSPPRLQRVNRPPDTEMFSPGDGRRRRGGSAPSERRRNRRLGSRFTVKPDLARGAQREVSLLHCAGWEVSSQNGGSRQA
jgi:hypothetical protein